MSRERQWDRAKAGGCSGAAKTGDQGAETILTAMVSDSPAFRHQTSHWSRTFCGTKLSDHDGSAVVGMTTDWLRAD